MLTEIKNQTASDGVPFFPKDYFQSRTRFFELAHAHGANVASFQQGSRFPLYTDAALFGSTDAKNVVVVVSGTHGVEGYAGAACQFWTIEKLLPKLPRDSELAILLVHALNPWGFAHDRRVTEEGVDLNRNFVETYSKQQHSTEYSKYHHILSPKKWHSIERLLSDFKLLKLLLSSQRYRVGQAITGGQYDCPSGLFYGGNRPSLARLTWGKIEASYLKKKNVKALIDIHTGLGSHGQAYLLSDRRRDDLEFLAMKTLFGDLLNSTEEVSSISSKNRGTFSNHFDMLQPGISYGFVLEFGTYHALKVLNALRRDQCMNSVEGEANSNVIQDARKKMRNAFFPDSLTWRKAIIRQYSDVFTKLVMFLNRTQPNVETPT